MKLTKKKAKMRILNFFANLLIILVFICFMLFTIFGQIRNYKYAFMFAVLSAIFGTIFYFVINSASAKDWELLIPKVKAYEFINKYSTIEEALFYLYINLENEKFQSFSLKKNSEFIKKSYYKLKKDPLTFKNNSYNGEFWEYIVYHFTKIDRTPSQFISFLDDLNDKYLKENNMVLNWDRQLFVYIIIVDKYNEQLMKLMNTNVADDCCSTHRYFWFHIAFCKENNKIYVSKQKTFGKTFSYRSMTKKVLKMFNLKLEDRIKEKK